MILCLFLELNICSRHILDRSCKIQHILKVYKEHKTGKRHILKNFFYFLLIKPNKQTNIIIAPLLTEKSTIYQCILKCTVRHFIQKGFHSYLEQCPKGLTLYSQSLKDFQQVNKSLSLCIQKHYRSQTRFKVYI